jgi:hypothetical protein
MSIIGSGWKEEDPSDDDIRRFNETTGGNFQGSKKDLEKQIEKHKESGWASRQEIRDLSDLEDEIMEN